jgi:hypothetical protein
MRFNERGVDDSIPVQGLLDLVARQPRDGASSAAA